MGDRINLSIWSFNRNGCENETQLRGQSIIFQLVKILFLFNEMSRAEQKCYSVGSKERTTYNVLPKLTRFIVFYEPYTNTQTITFNVNVVNAISNETD